MPGLDKAMYNQAFFRTLRKPGGIEKLNFAIGDYVATKVREDSFLDKILPPETVQPTELQGNEMNDTLYALCEIEPEDTKALVLNIDGQPTGKVFSAPRFRVNFWVNSTRRFEKPERELLAYKMTIKEIVQRNAVNQLAVLQDTQWLAQCAAAVTASGKIVVGTGGPDPNRTDLVELINQIDGDQLETDTLLMRKDDWNKILKLDSSDIDLGAWETFRNGYTERMLLGRKVIVSVKNVIDPGQIWAFAAPNFIGKHFVIEDAVAEVKSEWGLFQFQIQKYFGFAVGNVNGIALLQLV